MSGKKFAVAKAVLAADVADDGTVDIAYPSGTSQLSFNAGLAGSGHYVILNNNDRLNNADPGVSLAFGASLITITNLSGFTWKAGTELLVMLDQVEDGDVTHLQFPIDLVSITGAGDVVTEWRPGIEGFIESFDFVVTKPVTTAAKLATLNLEIDTTNLTGGLIALTSAASTPLGKVIAGSAITGNNKLTRESKLSIEASAVTAFSEGQGVAIVRVRKYAP